MTWELPGVIGALIGVWVLVRGLQREADARYAADTHLLTMAYMERPDRLATIPSELTQRMAIRLGERRYVTPPAPKRY